MLPTNTTDVEAVNSTGGKPVIVEKDKYHDRLAAILFYSQFVLFLLGATYCIIHGRLSLQDEAAKMFRSILISVLAWNTGIIFSVSFILTLIAHYAIKLAPGTMMHLSSILAWILACCFSLLTVIYVNVIVGGLYGLLSMIIIIVYVRNIKHIDLSSSILELVSHTAHGHPSLIAMLLVSTLGAQFYASIAALSVWGIFLMMPKSVGVILGNLAFLLTVSVFWTAQVTLNLLRTIVSGVYGKDHGKRPEEPSHTSTTLQMMQVAYGRGFGSICLGSTLVWIVSTIRFIFCKVQEFSPVESPELDKLVVILDGWARNFNYMAFTHVAIRRQSYLQAANETWDRVRSTGVIEVMSDLYVGEFITFLSFTIAFTAAFADLAIKHVYFDSKVEDLLKSFIGSIILGLVIPELYLMLIDAGTTATLICFADNPSGLQRARPSLYEVIKKRYPQLHSPLPTIKEEVGDVPASDK